ncbi:MAG: HAD-IIB family hydrolase [Ruminococcaceae bacterium]|nr:HAD-IIB family hydrolase [Oscillospiraceae bacterium]
MKFDNCLLVSDMDGTLMDKGYINPRNYAAIEEFIDLGGTFAIATGRCSMAIDHLVKNFKDLKYSIVYNGGMVYDYTIDGPVAASYLPEEDKTFFKDVLEKFPDMGVEVFCDKTVYLINFSEPCKVHCDYEHLKPVTATYDEIKDLKWNKAMCMYYAGFPEEKLEEMSKERAFVNSSFTWATFELDGIVYRGFEQLPGGAHKGYGLENLSKMLSIPKENTFAIGDFYNDAEMLKTAGVSSCPAASPDDIKALVDFVSCPCDDGAVAEFIEYLKKK